MNQQSPGGPPDGQAGPWGSGGAAPSPFSRQGAGDGAGLGPEPDPSANEPDGYVGQPGGPGPQLPPAGHDHSASSQSSAPHAQGPYSAPGPYQPSTPPTTPYPAQPNPYAQSGPYAQPDPYAQQTPYAPPSGASAPTEPYPSNQGPAPASQYPPNPYETGGQSGYGGYAYPPNPYAYGPMPEAHPKGTVALVLGIIGVVVCQPAGVVGFVISAKARREVLAEPQRYNNGGQITAGWVLGIISIVLTVLWVIYLVFVVGAIVLTEMN